MGFIKRYDGQDWIIVSGPTNNARYLQGDIVSRPNAAEEILGTFYWASDTNVLYYCDGEAWANVYEPDFDHNSIPNRNALNAHSISSITNLSPELNDRPTNSQISAVYFPKTGGTLSGKLIVPNIELGSDSLGTSGTVNLNLNSTDFATQNILTGNITYTSSNRSAGRSITVRVINGSTLRTVSFPAGWRFVSEKPTEIEPSKVAILTITAFGTSDSDIVAAWAVEE